jgi:anti-sigma regulatory factor (Ser/Thr protein kinase)
VPASVPSLLRVEREIPLDTAALARAQDDIAGFLQAQGAERVPASRVRLVIEELVANLLMHGRFAGPSAVVRVAVEVAPDAVVVVIEDTAEPFDPRATPASPAMPGLDEDTLGGLGLPLVRRMATITAYGRLPGGWNRTELAVARQPVPPG